MNYNELFKLFHDSDAEDWHPVYLQTGRVEAYLKSNLDVRVISSSEDEHIQNENFYADWANRWPNKKAVGYYYDLYYRNTLVTRFVLVSVDGSRALLPVPDSHDSNVVALSKYKVAEIFAGAEFYTYFKNSGLEVSKIRDMF